MRISRWLSGLHMLFVVCESQKIISLRESPVDLPMCAQTCIAPVLTSLGFQNTSFSDLAQLLCNNIESMREISSCLQKDCSYSDHVIAWPFQKTLCLNELIPSRSRYIMVLTITMALLASVFVVMRCYSRVCVTKRFWWDDWDMLVAAILMVSIAVLMIWDSTIGLGLHVWEVEVDNYTQVAKIFLVMKLFYVLVQVLLKVSILLFYLRCFPVKWVQVVTWILITITFMHGFAFFFAILFQCTPIAVLWNARIKGGKCIELTDIIFPGAILAILEDVAILTLPIPCISALKVGKGKRLSVGTMFGVGFLATLVSVLRAPYAWNYRDSLDQSWDTIDLLAWSEAELTVATICVCLPSLKPILNKYCPRYFSEKTGHYVGDIRTSTIQAAEFITTAIPPTPPIAKVVIAQSRVHIQRNGERSSDENDSKPYVEHQEPTESNRRPAHNTAGFIHLADGPREGYAESISLNRCKRKAKLKAKPKAGPATSRSERAATPSECAGKGKDVMEDDEEPLSLNEVLRDAESEEEKSGTVRTDRYEVFSKRGSLLSPTFLIMD